MIPSVLLFGESMRFEHLIVNYLLPAIKNANEMLQSNNNNNELGVGFRDIDAIVPTWHHPIPLRYSCLAHLKFYLHFQFIPVFNKNMSYLLLYCHSVDLLDFFLPPSRIIEAFTTIEWHCDSNQQTSLNVGRQFT